MKPMTSAEIAARCGISRETFYVRRHRMHAFEGMPRPFTGRGSAPGATGKPKWDRATMEAWFARHHPAMPRVLPANDQAPPVAAEQDPRWAAALAAEYGGAR
jgi:hypothetical protein